MPVPGPIIRPALPVSWQAEVVVVLNKRRELRPSSFHAVGKEAGSTTRASAAFNIVAHDAGRLRTSAFDFRRAEAMEYKRGVSDGRSISA